MVSSADPYVLPAVYIGTQPGFRHLPAIELYNLLVPVGDHPVGSTVSRTTLERHGWTLPVVPTGRPAKRGSLKVRRDKTRRIVRLALN
jgi:hypothetical protein